MAGGAVGISRPPVLTLASTKKAAGPGHALNTTGGSPGPGKRAIPGTAPNRTKRRTPQPPLRLPWFCDDFASLPNWRAAGSRPGDRRPLRWGLKIWGTRLSVAANAAWRTASRKACSKLARDEKANVRMVTAGFPSNSMFCGGQEVYSSSPDDDRDYDSYAMAYQFDAYGTSYSAGFPGTMLQVESGDTLKLHLTNDLAGDNDACDSVFTTHLQFHGSHAPDLS